jgi:hypothetical protein
VPADTAASVPQAAGKQLIEARHRQAVAPVRTQMSQAHRIFRDEDAHAAICGVVEPGLGEPARDLRILNKPLWLLQRDLLAHHCRGAEEVDSLSEIPSDREELLVYRDNLFFNDLLIDTFIKQAKASGHACQIAFARDDKSITTHGLRLQDGITLSLQHNVFIADLFYYPNGIVEEAQPLVIDTEPREMGYYHIPSYMAPNQGDLIFQVPKRVFLSIESWVHVFLANSPFGVFSWGRIHEDKVDGSWKEKLAVSLSHLRARHQDHNRSPQCLTPGMWPGAGAPLRWR